MSFRILGLSPEAFAPLFLLDDAALGALGVRRFVADEPHSAPCRITLEDAEPGERLLLMNHQHQPADSPFRASGPIFVREKGTAGFDAEGIVPDALHRRMLSVRAYDAQAMMVRGQLVPGADVGALLEEWLAEPEVEEVHLHYAARGCYAARAVRSQAASPPPAEEGKPSS